MGNEIIQNVMQRVAKHFYHFALRETSPPDPLSKREGAPVLRKHIVVRLPSSWERGRG